jgi:hypothetical protein
MVGELLDAARIFTSRNRYVKAGALPQAKEQGITAGGTAARQGFSRLPTWE